MTDGLQGVGGERGEDENNTGDLEMQRTQTRRSENTRGEDENTGFLEMQRTRPTRIRKPSVRPYDKYLLFPGAK